MSDKKDVVGRALALLRDPAGVADELSDPRRARGVALSARAVIVTDGLESAEESPELDAGTALLIEGAKALRKIDRDGADANLSEDELVALEAVILTTGRPALLVQNGTFPVPPSDWTVLEDNRASIERTLRSVGRIETANGTHIGTGFLVADDLIMTNRHVVKEFSDADGDDWVFNAGTNPLIDYLREDGSKATARFALDRVVGVHKHDKVDMALMRVSRKPKSGDATPAPPLTIATEAPPENRASNLYLVGYPASDNEGKTPRKVLQDIFNNKFGVKRLQPGQTKSFFDRTFSHDASTLGGSSGSCVLDLDRNQVIGLHYSGTYGEANFAVALWKLADDPLLKGRVRFDV